MPLVFSWVGAWLWPKGTVQRAGSPGDASKKPLAGAGSDSPRACVLITKLGTWDAGVGGFVCKAPGQGGVVAGDSRDFGDASGPAGSWVWDFLLAGPEAGRQ